MNKEELLYRHFSNTLSPEDQRIFDDLLSNDAAFKAEFEFQKSIREATKESRHRELRAKLQNFENSISEKDDISKSNISYWKIAASILFLVAASWFTYNSFSDLDYDELYAEHATIYPNTVYAITRSDTINSLEREAFVAYEAKNYELAFAKISEASPQSYTSFYKGQILLELGRIQEATAAFERTVEANQTFVSESLWYLALIKIKEENGEHAIALLEELTGNGNYKKLEARELIETLR